MTGTGTLLDSIFIFGIYDYFLFVECFPEPVEMAVYDSRAVKRIRGIILVNCESFVWSIKGLLSIRVYS